MSDGTREVGAGRAHRPRLLMRFLQLAVLVLIAWLVWRSLAPELARVTLEDFLQWRPALTPLLLSFLLLLGMYSAHALLWRRITTDLHAPRASLRTIFRVYFLASLGRYVPGKVWQLAGLAVLAQRAGLPAGTSMAAAVFAQFAFLTTGLLLLAVLLPGYAEFWPAVIAAGLIAAGALGGYLVVATPLGHRAREAVLRRAGPGRARLETAFSIADRVRVSDAVRWELLYALTWLVLGGAFGLFVGAFVPAASSPADARFHAGVVAASYLAGYVVMIMPAGAGVRELTMSALLAQHPAIPASAAVLISVASRVWFTAAELLPLALVPVLPDGDQHRQIESDAVRTR
ncbi:MAG TPA: lysylphosphatidylglycerol synthase domain-containing protein [Longimicrobiales bacterium]|nr:lysylphosphatidylglycerol synthase domain-containing protein [Longimicrobiales bacterium]